MIREAIAILKQTFQSVFNYRENTPSKALYSACALVFLFSGCSIGPDYERRELKLPESFNFYQDTSLDPENGKSIANIGWWELFSDATLKELIKKSLENNRDLKVAISRIEMARAQLRFVRADQFPNLSGGASAQRRDPSNSALSFVAVPVNDFGLLSDLSFELDIWGKLRRATESERAQLLSTEYAKQSLTIQLIANVASAYFRLLNAENQLRIAETTLENRQHATEIIKARFEQGATSELDLNQTQIEEYAAAITAATARRERAHLASTLSVLIGDAPTNIKTEHSLFEQKIDLSIPYGYPADLLERRPDVLSVEQQVRAAVAKIGVAQANRLPSLNILGMVGWQSEDVSDLLKRDAFTWTIGGDLLGPIVDFGKSKSGVELAQAQAKSALNEYEQKVLLAVQEVQDSLVSISSYAEESRNRKLQLEAAQSAANLARARYDQGVTSYLDLLDIERSLFEAQLGSSSSYANYLEAIVVLYRALGGGWNLSNETQAK